MDIRDVIVAINPILRGWGNYFRTGNAAIKFVQIDRYVVRRLCGLMIKRLAGTCVPGNGGSGHASSSRLTACIACVAPVAIRDSRRDHQEDHR